MKRVTIDRKAAAFDDLSIDGSGFSKWAKKIGPGLRWIEGAMADEQLVMFGGNA